MTLNSFRRIDIELETLHKSWFVAPGTEFPGKALDLLRELARSMGDEDEVKTIDTAALLALLSEKTGLPEELFHAREGLDADAVQKQFEANVMGQGEAIKATIELILKIRAGLTDPARPYGVYLFTGLTGTGKTELARSIAAA